MFHGLQCGCKHPGAIEITRPEYLPRHLPRPKAWFSLFSQPIMHTKWNRGANSTTLFCGNVILKCWKTHTSHTHTQILLFKAKEHDEVRTCPPALGSAVKSSIRVNQAEIGRCVREEDVLDNTV